MTTKFTGGFTIRVTFERQKLGTASTVEEAEEQLRTLAREIVEDTPNVMISVDVDPLVRHVEETVADGANARSAA